MRNNALADKEIKCDVCGKLFENKSKLYQHKQENHLQKQPKTKPSKSSRYKATGIAAIVAIAIVAAVYYSENSPSPPSGTIQGIQCEPTEGSVFHIHAHIDVIVNEKMMTVPAYIGIKQNECLYWLHTHNTSGMIHIESPEQKSFTLAQFIAVWNNTPGISPTFDQIVNNDKNLKIIINGKVTNSGFDKITLNAHDEIVIVSGTMPPSVPSDYDFGGQ